MSTRSKSLVREQESLLISGIDTSKIHKRLDNYTKPGSSNLLSSRLEFSSSPRSDDPIKVQDSFSISEIYKELETNKENMLIDLENSKGTPEASDFFRLLEDNTYANSKQKAYSKLDESSIVAENCKIIVNPQSETLELLKKQQKKYYQAFMVLQAHFVSAKESSERKIHSLTSQLSEVNGLINENREFSYRLEASVNSRVESIKEEMTQKFKIEAERMIEKYRNRDTQIKDQTKNKIMSLRKEVDRSKPQAFQALDESRAKNSEDLLRKNCEMRLKFALMQSDSSSLNVNY